MNCELPDVQAGFRKGRGIRDQIANICWIIKKSERVPEKHLPLLYWLHQSFWLYGSQQTVENSSRDGNTRPPELPPRNPYAGQEVTVRIGHGTTDWFQIGKRICQGCIFSPCLFNSYVEYIMRTLGWMKYKMESRFLGEISITSDMQMTPALWQKAKSN